MKYYSLPLFIFWCDDIKIINHSIVYKNILYCTILYYTLLHCMSLRSTALYCNKTKLYFILYEYTRSLQSVMKPIFSPAMNAVLADGLLLFFLVDSHEGPTNPSLKLRCWGGRRWTAGESCFLSLFFLFFFLFTLLFHAPVSCQSVKSCVSHSHQLLVGLWSAAVIRD